jgi:N-acetylmuramoyl-L-alanine amidase
MFVTVKKNLIFWFAVFFAFIFTFGFLVSKATLNASVNLSPLELTIVIDAGHGGLDGGSVGTTTGITENELNLIYAKKLGKYLSGFGFNVVQTRTTPDGLYSTFSENYKREDMINRQAIIEEAQPQIVLSIHMNKYVLPSENGAQVFYGADDQSSQDLANSIRDKLRLNFENARELTLVGDYYLLNNAVVSTVIVECGFLSNPEEEILLQQEDYQEKMCYAIFCGVIKFLGVANF